MGATSLNIRCEYKTVANTTSALIWLFANAERFQLEMERSTWISELGLLEHETWHLNAQQWAAKNQTNCSFFELGSRGALCRIERPNAKISFGGRIGTAYSVSRSESAFHAFVQTARSIDQFLNSSHALSPLTLEDFNKFEKPGFAEHGRLALNLKYFHQLDFLFKERLSSRATKNHEELQEFTFDEIQIGVPDLPFKFVSARSQSSQNLWTGHTESTHLNLKRLSNFAGRSLAMEDLFLLPHPLD